MGTLKPQSNGPLHSSTVIGRLAVDGWVSLSGLRLALDLDLDLFCAGAVKRIALSLSE